MTVGTSTHLRGVAIAAAGTLCLVPDATLIRLADADDLRIVFWRSLFVGLSLAVVSVARHRARVVYAYRSIGRAGVAVAVAWGLALVGFVVSINNTAVANTLVILATAPFFAALATRLLLGDTVRRRTWVAMVAAFAGVVVTFAGRSEVGGMVGNLAAVGVAAVLGTNLTIIRRAAGVDMLPAISLAGFVAAALALPAAWPVGISLHDAVVIGAMGLVLVPAAFGLVALGTRYLPSPEVSLVMLLETVLGPLLAWAVVGEAPPAAAAVGGTIVVLAIAVHGLVALRDERVPADAAVLAVARPTVAVTEATDPAGGEPD
ncbi:MAG: DMT family transporter [Acidimicrobiales bacterium]|nr:DMT family transporter [Acidimicrobiales bacterium]